MSYIQQVLQPSETVRFRTNVYWFVYLAAMAALIGGLGPKDGSGRHDAKGICRALRIYG
jgi:hypothetical protein